MKPIYITTILGSLFLLSACASNCENPAAATQPTAAGANSECPAVKTAPKLTKDMFYKNGVFDQDAARQAYFDLMTSLGYPISDNMRENMWATDFGLGDFPAVGMGGIFWAQENKHGVFGHEILLLPNQMLVEHYHVEADGLPAKYECWQARAGSTYCLGEEGEDMSKFPNLKIPESQKNFVTQKKVTLACSKKGNVVWLNKPLARHSQIAGPKGAIVTEYGAFHGNNAQRFTNPKVKF